MHEDCFDPPLPFVPDGNLPSYADGVAAERERLAPVIEAALALAADCVPLVTADNPCPLVVIRADVLGSLVTALRDAGELPAKP